jgi:NAD(P)-dependent dehydrogenase (short-subunit alcohol dehydrogenase family)
MIGVDLKGRVVIVTGSSRGIGMVMAKGLAEAGARVVLAATNRANLEKVAGAIGKDRALPVVTDVTEPADCKRVVDQAVKTWGDVAVLINCARVITDDHEHLKFWLDDPDYFRRSMVVNITGYFNMAHAVAPHLIKRKWGRIVNVTTSIRTMTRKENSPYGVSKGANEAETLIWSQDLDGTGVTCNSLLPGGSCERETRPTPANSKLIKPTVMVPPAIWLSSELSDGHTGERYVGRLWDASLPIAQAAKGARVVGAYNEPEGNIT